MNSKSFSARVCPCVLTLTLVLCGAVRAQLYTNTNSFTLSNTTFASLVFTNWIPLGSLPTDATLLTVSVNAVISNSTATFANDLAIYVGEVDPVPINAGSGRFLQIGGDTSLLATNRLSWTNGGSLNDGTPVSGTYDVSAQQINLFTSGVWIGNGYEQPSGTGTWTGTATVTYSSTVPEPGSVALAALGLGIVGAAMWRRARERSRG